MERLHRFTFDNLSDITDLKKGEIKFGERIQILPKDQDLSIALKVSEAKYVLVGIPENIGVRAKTGKSGACTVWEYTLKNLVNIQHNKFCKGSNLLILGHLDVSEEMVLAETLDSNDKEQRKTYYKLVEQLDKQVSHLVFTILKAGKVPIIIGGGQNNAYGAIKGSALASGKPINAINFDAFSHFKMTEGRHSGNSFSYAFEEGFLKNYFIFGLHENYISKSIYDNLKKLGERIKYNTYEQIAIRKEKSFTSEMNNALQFIENEGFGVDVDLDSMTILSSNNLFSSGFQAYELRQFVSHIAKSKQVRYFHVSEGSFSVADYNNSEQVGKLIAILIADFMKANQQIVVADNLNK